MAYSTGSVSTATQLILALESFCAGNGWTVNLSGADGAGRRLHLMKNGAYANFSTSNATYLIQMNMSDGFSAGAAWSVQPTIRSPVTNCALIVGSINILPCTYHFFAHDDFIAAVFMSSGGTVTQLMFGNMAKIGTYTGGSFGGAGISPPAATTNTPTMVQLPSVYAQNAASFIGPYALTDTIGEDSRFSAAPLMPINLFDFVNPRYYPLGTLPNVRALSRTYAQGEELTFGTDVWKVFYTVSTSYLCFAYKK